MVMIKSPWHWLSLKEAKTNETMRRSLSVSNLLASTCLEKKAF